MFHSNALFTGPAPRSSPAAPRCCGAASRRRRAARHPEVWLQLHELRRQAALVHPRPAGARRRHRQSAAASVRQRGGRPRHRALREALDVRVVDNYGSTESGAMVLRVPDTPKGALGRADAATGCSIPRRAKNARSRSSTPKAARERRRGDRRARQHGRQGDVRGLLQERGRRPQRMRDGMYWTGDSPTATPTASSTSRAATSSGCASTARTRRRAGRAISRATRAWYSRRSTPCPTRRWATR